MAADSNALTLYDYGMASNEPLVKKFTMGLYDQGTSVLDVLPIVTSKSLKAKGTRFLPGSLPTIGTRKLNDELDTFKSVPKTFEEQAYIIGNRFQIDNKILNEKNAISDPVAAVFQAWQKSFVRTFSDKFINAVPTTDDEWFSGIRYRVGNADGRAQYDIPTEMHMAAGGSTIDITMGAMTSATAEAFFEQMDKALDYVGSPEGNGVVVFMNDDLFRRIPTAAKRANSGNGLDQTKDNFDRMITTYRNARLIQLPRKSNDTSQIITSTETTAGVDGASTYTSMYVCRFGADRFTGWQDAPLEVKNLGVDPTQGTRVNIVVDWMVGLFQTDPRAIARVYGLKIS
jgi:hypothetical protein